MIAFVILCVAAIVALSLLRSSDPGSKPAPVETNAAGCGAPDLRTLDYSRTDQGDLAWADEFKGATVDRNRWTVRDQTSLSFDQAGIRAGNVSVRDGKLVIQARRERAGDRAFTTGYLDTIGHFSQRHGRWEVRARLPVTPGSSRGLWPAFWLRADEAPGEVDVMEAWGTPADHPGAGSGRYGWAVHEDTRAPKGSDRFHGWGTAAGQSSLADGFHVFAVDWSPRCLKFTLDGAVTGSVAMDAADWLRTSLSGTVNIRLNLQVGSDYWGRVDEDSPGSTRLPADLVVDYVRVYRPNRDVGAGSGKPAQPFAS